jgi:hypothetical protein
MFVCVCCANYTEQWARLNDNYHLCQSNIRVTSLRDDAQLHLNIYLPPTSDDASSTVNKTLICFHNSAAALTQWL